MRRRARSMVCLQAWSSRDRSAGRGRGTSALGARPVAVPRTPPHAAVDTSVRLVEKLASPHLKACQRRCAAHRARGCDPPGQPPNPRGSIRRPAMTAGSRPMAQKERGHCRRPPDRSAAHLTPEAERDCDRSVGAELLPTAPIRRTLGGSIVSFRVRGGRLVVRTPPPRCRQAAAMSPASASPISARPRWQDIQLCAGRAAGDGRRHLGAA